MRMSQTDTQGSGNFNNKSKAKKRKRGGKRINNGKATNQGDLMTKEDEELLQYVEDEDDECAIDVDEEGDDNIATSEISGFLQKLGIDKYRPFQTHQKENVEAETESGNSNSNENCVNIEIEEEPDKKSKKKKKKSAPEDVEIKEEPDRINDVSKKKNKKDKRKKPPGDKVAENENTTVKEEKPDLKALQAAMSYLRMNKTRSFMLLKSGELWREEKVYPSSNVGPEDKLVQEAVILAERLLKDDITHYAKQRENVKRSEARWVKTVLVSGTLSDKIAALTLLIQESPVHNLSSIDNLLAMASKKGRREAMMAVDTLRDLFITGLLPDDRKLKYFYQFPLYSLCDMTSGNVDQRDRLLICWYFEDLVKKKYSKYIKILGEMLFDSLQATKENAIKTIHKLLVSKPEQEHVLLPMLVNKMGDQQLNNKVSHLMIKLVEEHPNMKGVIVKEICQLLYRPNVSQRAQYYAICFLTQLRLSNDESSLATELIKVYLSFFQTYLKKHEIDSKTMSALLTGVNRAYVFASEEKSEVLGQMNEVYKIIPTVNFRTGVQALMLLYHVTDTESNAATRFYSALYRKLNDVGLASTTKHTIFLNLLFKSMKRDSMDNRIMAFIKRTLQVYAHHPAQVICGVLILLSQVLSEKPNILKLACKTQVNWTYIEDAENDGDDEEKFVDLPIPEEFLEKDQEKSTPVTENGESSEVGSKEAPPAAQVTTSWLHIANKGQKDRTSYDPIHRNPLYSKAELECLWELEGLAKHFHPTVALYASMLLKGESITYNGDPLADYTLIRFLDRFVYKNPKKPTQQMSVGAPKRKAVTGIRNIPVNSKEYLSQTAVPEDEQFFFKYFATKENLKKDQDDDDDDESVGDDEFDKYMDKFIDGRKEDFGDLKLDFAGDAAKSKGQKRNSVESESDDDDDDLEEGMDFGDDDLAAEFERELEGLGGSDNEDMSMRLGNDDDGFNEDDVEFSADENDPLDAMMMKPKRNDKKRLQNELISGVSEKGGKKRRKMDTDNLFASAEEFSHLLEEGIESGSVSLGGADQMRNQDKAAKKQIAWEEKRDKWIKGNGRPFKRRPKGKPFHHGSSGGGKPKQGSNNKSKFGKKGK